MTGAATWLAPLSVIWIFALLELLYGCRLCAARPLRCYLASSWNSSRPGRLHVAPRERNRSLIWRHSLVVLRAAPVAGGRPTLRHNRIAGGVVGGRGMRGRRYELERAPRRTRCCFDCIDSGLQGLTKRERRPPLR